MSRDLVQLVVCLWAIKGAIVVDCDDFEYRLIRDMLRNYDARVRPSLNASEPLNVTFGLALAQIIDVDEKNQIITTNCWLNQVWIDYKLRWNPARYGGIKVIRLPYDAVWKPDILLYNNADVSSYKSSISTNVIVTSDGNVTWLSMVIFRSSCAVDVKYFPFDEQNCTMLFSSWTYDGFQLNLDKVGEDGDISNFIENSEWTLIKLHAVRNVVFYSCCAEPYPDVTYAIQIRRKPLFYVFNMILPCLLITLVALLGFYIPSDSGEKVTMGITTLLSMTVFLMLVAENMPPTSDVLPLVGLYYGITIAIVSLATAMTSFTLNIHHTGMSGYHVPNYVKVICFKFLARLLFVRLRAPLQHVDTINFNNNQSHFRPDYANKSTAAIGEKRRHVAYTSMTSRPATIVVRSTSGCNFSDDNDASASVLEFVAPKGLDGGAPDETTNLIELTERRNILNGRPGRLTAGRDSPLRTVSGTNRRNGGSGGGREGLGRGGWSGGRFDSQTARCVGRGGSEGVVSGWQGGGGWSGGGGGDKRELDHARSSISSTSTTLLITPTHCSSLNPTSATTYNDMLSTSGSMATSSGCLAATSHSMAVTSAYLATTASYKAATSGYAKTNLCNISTSAGQPLGHQDQTGTASVLFRTAAETVNSLHQTTASNESAAPAGPSGSASPLLGGGSRGDVPFPASSGANTTIAEEISKYSHLERQLLRTLEKVQRTVERNEFRLAEQDRRDVIKQDWEMVALVVDRVLLLVFVVATLSITMAILLHAPHSREFIFGWAISGSSFESGKSVDVNGTRAAVSESVPIDSVDGDTVISTVRSEKET